MFDQLGPSSADPTTSRPEISTSVSSYEDDDESDSYDSASSESYTEESASESDRRPAAAKKRKEVERLQKLARKAKPVYEDYMPASAERSPSPAGSDEKSIRPSSESDYSESESESVIEKRIRAEVLRALNAGKKKTGDKAPPPPPKGAKIVASAKTKEKVGGKQKPDGKAKEAVRGKKKEGKVVRPGLTFKQRRQLQSWVKQASQYLTKIADAVVDERNNDV